MSIEQQYLGNTEIQIGDRDRKIECELTWFWQKCLIIGGGWLYITMLIF
jgi:hypothetical protein